MGRMEYHIEYSAGIFQVLRRGVLEGSENPEIAFTTFEEAIKWIKQNSNKGEKENGSSKDEERRRSIEGVCKE